MNEVAVAILRRTNMLGISISELCREVGVSRTWFEQLKTHVPKSLDTFLKIGTYLDEHERTKKG